MTDSTQDAQAEMTATFMDTIRDGLATFPPRAQDEGTQVAKAMGETAALIYRVTNDNPDGAYGVATRAIKGSKVRTLSVASRCACEPQCVVHLGVDFGLFARVSDPRVMAQTLYQEKKALWRASEALRQQVGV